MAKITRMEVTFDPLSVENLKNRDERDCAESKLLFTISLEFGNGKQAASPERLNEERSVGAFRDCIKSYRSNPRYCAQMSYGRGIVKLLLSKVTPELVFLYAPPKVESFGERVRRLYRIWGVDAEFFDAGLHSWRSKCFIYIVGVINKVRVYIHSPSSAGRFFFVFKGKTEKQIALDLKFYSEKTDIDRSMNEFVIGPLLRSFENDEEDEEEDQEDPDEDEDE
ncbi:hypothetical protein HK102_003257 [Quaeritorhiza haematococci]|nr:hypothetical protein HK102_003257 [Quaeritorhiza haematococci]